MFDPVAESYDQARPTYPEEIYDALSSELGTFHGAVVIDVGAGTGIASRQLLARGASVVALDIAPQMLQRTRLRTPHPLCIVGDGNVLPLRSRSAQLMCFAQAWHWFDAPVAGAEVARVVGRGGLWAAWWSHPRADGEPWFDRYQDLVEAACDGYQRAQRDTGHRSWSDEPIARTGLFDRGRRTIVGWIRSVDLDRWILEERSKSYVDALDASLRERLLVDLRAVIGTGFPGSEMRVPYVTHMWTARAR
jgi:SAM-dependent methyltransferase